MKMTINLRKVLFFLLTLCLIGSAYAQDTALKEAEVAYTKEDYAKAIELYEGILKSNGESAAVYYNLGNAYYKAGKIAPAILNYERCLLLDPGDSDARFNLQMARQKTIDKIEPVGDFFLANGLRAWRISDPQTLGRRQVSCASFVYRLLDLVLFLPLGTLEEDRFLFGCPIYYHGCFCQYIRQRPEG